MYWFFGGHIILSKRVWVVKVQRATESDTTLNFCWIWRLFSRIIQSTQSFSFTYTFWYRQKNLWWWKKITFTHFYYIGFEKNINNNDFTCYIHRNYCMNKLQVIKKDLENINDHFFCFILWSIISWIFHFGIIVTF